MGLVEKSLAYMGVKRYHRPTSDTDFGYMINFGDIQRMYMRFLHTKLLNIAAKVQRGSRSHDSKVQQQKLLKRMNRLGPVLKRYGRCTAWCFVPDKECSSQNMTVRAVRDHEYMATFALRHNNDPFVATSRRYHDRILFEKACQRTGLSFEDCLQPSEEQPAGTGSGANTEGDNSRSTTTTAIGGDELEACQQRQKQWVDDLIKASIPTGPWETFDDGDMDTPASGLISTRTTSAKKAFWGRVGAAVIGGAFLITPMWILALQRQLYVHLGVATGFVTAFGITMSLYSETMEGVFTATLAYAAVIMVFVGVVLEETGGNGA